MATGLLVPKGVLDSYHYDTEGVTNAVQIYLSFGSIIFLLYLLLGLTRPSRSVLNDTGHTSAFVRVGAFVFGMGSIGYLTIRLIEDFYNYDCSKVQVKLVRFLMLVVSMLQMMAVILCSRIKIDQGWGAAHFGCMHLVATNLVTWVSVVYKESEHVMHLAADITRCLPENRTETHPRTKRAAGGGNSTGSDCAPFYPAFEEIFYPFQIEFVLIGKYLSCLFISDSHFQVP